MAVEDYSTTADENTSISGINIAEGCPPSGINNAIRQMMADVKAKTDSLDETIETAIEDAQEIADGKLSLSGGTMTGAIVSDVALVMKRSVDNSSIVIYGDTGPDTKGPAFSLRGRTNSTTPAQFECRAGDGTNVYTLIGKPTGSLTWGGKNVTVEGDCLPLTGGTATGTISISRNSTSTAVADCMLSLGNSTSDGTANAGRGLIRIYGEDTHYHNVRPPKTASGNRAYYLSDNSTATGAAQYNIVSAPSDSTGKDASVGSSTRPVYIDATGVVKQCGTSLAVSVTGSAATATSADSATTATKLGTTTVGGATQPVYLSSGAPTACTMASGTGTTGLARVIAMSLNNSTPATGTNVSGYIQIGNLQICYGHHKAASSGTITFPRAFTSVTTVITQVSEGSTASTLTGGVGWSTMASDVKPASFRFNSTTNLGFDWIAIGYYS